MSMTAAAGTASLGLLLLAIVLVLRQLGAGGAAKGLILATAAVFLVVIASTYGPALLQRIPG
jgi:hypothetical protein